MALQNLLQKGRGLKIPAKNLQKVLICFEGAAANELAPGGMVRSSLAKYSKFFLKFLPRFTNICKPSTGETKGLCPSNPEFRVGKGPTGQGNNNP